MFHLKSFTSPSLSLAGEHQQPTDANGEPVKKGDKVLYKKAPSDLLSGLPEQDQNVIIAQEGKTLVIVGFDEVGKAELEFISHQFNVYTTTHTIWIDPKELFKVTR